jgi:hypothetical protein
MTFISLGLQHGDEDMNALEGGADDNDLANDSPGIAVHRERGDA